MSATRRLCEFATETRYEDIPAEAREAARLAILNILGTAAGGTRTRIGRMHLDLARRLGGGLEEATLIGDGTKVSVPAAAYANGNLGFALDYEDMIHYIVHPGYITTAAGLAVGEPRRLSGRDLLTAVVLGFEIGGRLADSMQPTPERGAQVWGEQYHPFLAAVVAGRLMGFDAQAMDVAFGIAGTYATVPSAYKYFGRVEETRPMREIKLGWGWMAMAGVMAALSVEEGFRGGHGVLDGDQGFYVMAGSDRCDWEVMTAGLGTKWLVTETEYKIHPSIGFNHPGYWATRELVEAHDIRPEAVEAIHISGMQLQNIGDTSPSHAVDAQFSLPYTVASTILREKLVPSMYDEKKLEDPMLRRLLARTVCRTDPACDADFFNEQRMRFTIRITLGGGAVHEREIEFPRDKPPYGRAEVEAKVREVAGEALPGEKVEGLIAAVDRLDELDEVGELVSWLVA